MTLSQDASEELEILRYLCQEKDNEIKQLKDLCQEKDNEVKKLKYLLQLREGRGKEGGGPDENLKALSEGSGIQYRLLEENSPKLTETSTSSTLRQYEISRYSRQLLLPDIGVRGQALLKNTSVLIVGAGGLGCPAGIYLAAAGIGKIGIVDYDDVEISNLHRQVIHTEKFIGHSKCESFISAIKNLNTSVCCVAHEVLLNSHNAKDIIIPYDIVVDATDNAPTRYLLNDACVFYKKPLVSGSALKFEGQLTIYNHDNGPCYRCLFPVPPSPNATTNCSEGGVLGVIPGIIGDLQALEVIKIATGMCPSYNKKLLIFDGKSGEFHCVKLRQKNPKCIVCGEFPTLTELIDYEKFCQTSASDKVEKLNILSAKERISCTEYKKILDDDFPHILLDVRPVNETAICALPNYVNIPFSKIDQEQNIQLLRTLIEEKACSENFIVCRRGNDSQRSVRILQDCMKDMDINWRDIEGGLEAWHKEIDCNFPLY